MKKNIAGAILIPAVAGYMIGIFAPSGEAATRGTPRDLATLQICITMLNEDARLPLDADLVVKKRLSDNYGLTLGKIDSLLGPNMQYGDLAAVLTFTKKMSGGKTDENINKVINLRQSGLGWDQIAENLRLDFSDVAGSLSRFEESTHSSIKQALVESSTGAAAGGTEENGQ
jgi:hypothetical protein